MKNEAIIPPVEEEEEEEWEKENNEKEPATEEERNESRSIKLHTEGVPTQTTPENWSMMSSSVSPP